MTGRSDSRGTVIAKDEILFELGVPEESIRRAVLAGEAGRDYCRSFSRDPIPPSGVHAVARTIGTLRTELSPLGWRSRRNSNVESVVSPDGKTAIVVETGNAATGNPNATPSTQWSKGKELKKQVQRNHQLGFEFTSAPGRSARRVKPNQLKLNFGALLDRFPFRYRPYPATWILLVCSQDGVVRLELSLPAEMDAKGFVVEWFARAPFDPISVPGPPGGSEADDQAAIDVDVHPRGR